MILKVDNINKYFDGNQILKDVSFEVERSEIISIVGKSGAGKTTLLQIIGTLLNQDSGRIIINNEDVSGFSQNKIADFRNRNLGFVFQFHQLLPEFTALENVMMPALLGKKDRKKSSVRAKELLDYLGLSDKFNSKPGQLSGGEQQRIAFARALINEPSLILADEPTGNLDSDNSNDVQKLIEKLRTDFQQTFIIVTHNESMANKGDRIIRMQDGEIIK
jgi:lipoprotein-releasing system ATP-binding protein